MSHDIFDGGHVKIDSTRIRIEIQFFNPDNELYLYVIIPKKKNIIENLN